MNAIQNTIEQHKQAREAEKKIREAIAMIKNLPAENQINYSILYEAKRDLFNALVDHGIRPEYDVDSERISNLVSFISNLLSWYGTPYVLLAARGLEDCNWHSESSRLFEMYDAMIEAEDNDSRLQDAEYETVNWWAD